MIGPIAIDYTPALTQGGGIGRYTRELIAALAEQDQTTPYRLFVAGVTLETLPQPPGSNFTWAPSRWSPAWFARIWHRLQLPLPIEHWTGSVQLLHAPDFTLPPTHRRTRTLLTVHDLSFVREPHASPPQLRSYLNRAVPKAVQRADRILADSYATKQDLLDLYRVPEEKIHVLYSGVHDRFYPVRDPILVARVRNRYKIGNAPYIFSVGTIQPRKNYDRLVEAFHQLGRSDMLLVIAGARGWLDDPLYQHVAGRGLADRVRFIGFVPDEDLPVLYSAAAVFAFPSLYEGFGLPPLEAMACGVPVLVSNQSSLPEVVGDAGVLVDPYNIDEIAGGLARLLDDENLRNTLINRAQLRVQSFTWRTAARQLREHYDELVG